MKRFFTALLTFVMFCTIAASSELPIPQQERVYPNLIANPGFENGSYGWTASGGATATANTTAKGIGTKGYDWDSNSAAQTLIATAVTIPAAYYGQNGQAWCRIKTPSGTATHTLVVDDGTNPLVSAITIASNASAFQKSSVNFVYPTSGSVRLKLTAVASNEPEIYIEDCYVGLATNVELASQVEFVGSVTYTGDSGCQWTTGDTGGAFTNFGAQANCDAGVGAGSATASSKIPGMAFATLKPGRYYAIAQCRLDMQSSGTTADMYYRLSDGTNAGETAYVWANSGSGFYVNKDFVYGEFNYTSVQTNVTIQLQASSDTNSNDPTIYNTVANGGCVLSLYRYPSTSETVFRPDVLNWRVDANIAGANPSLGVIDVTSYTGIENGSLTLTNNTGNGVIPAQIPCSSTNAPSGTTCSAGNESVGVSFNLPAAGDVRACVYFTHFFDDTADDVLSSAFQIVETPANAQTISQEGKSRIGPGATLPATAGFSDITTPMSVCGTFSFSSSGQKVLRLFYEQDVTSTPTDINILADALAAVGQRDIHWEVYPISQAMPAPVFVGSVTSSSAGPIRVEAAELNCDASSSITSQTGAISAIGNRATAACALTLVTGAFTATPYSCQVTTKAAAVQATACSCSSATACTIYGASSDYDAYVTLIGPR
jgi:hypothetical protein